MNRARTWMTNASCAFVAAACSTAPNDSHGGLAGSGGTASSSGGSASGVAGRGSGNGGAVNGTGGNSGASAAGASTGGAPLTSDAGGAPSSAAGSAGATGGAATSGNAGAAGSAGAAPVSNVLVTSASGAYWKTSTWTEATGAATVTVSAAKSYQTWDGFGGAFNELGWSYLTSKALQDQAIALLFGSDGCHFAWGRIPIGASDYATDRYTLNENSGDTEMSKFSIERDKQKLIPYIKAAQAVRPDLRFWASPWTPPTWMKSSPYQSPGNPVNAFDGGSMKSDDATLKAHALYFVKFIEAYAGQGIKIDYVAPQNEPNYSQNYPSAIWAPSTFTTFIGKYLGPALASQTPTTQLMLGTMSNANSNADVAVANAVLADATAKGFAKVMGVQWGMSDADQITNLQSKGPGIPIWLSEHKCGGSPGANVAAAPNDLNYAKDSWGYIRDAMKRGLTAYNAWNMVLDKGGKGIDNTRVWAQNALLVVDSGQIVQTPAYYVFRHFSQYVAPQAKRIDATGGDAVAFKNPDGSLVAIMYNSGAANNSYVVSIGGKSLQFAMPASGWATIRFSP
ncbi:MAG TPA: glycoside hydrolase family 30 beta sandwich domain-containing protein [Polyangiaceae bacterium]|nr:glycoside hydrolase family 30 beta sandwich domain-containing protein [Polyangiaceae bacterium]